MADVCTFVLLGLMITVGFNVIQIVCGRTNSGCLERSLVGNNSLHLPDSSYTASSYYNDASRTDKRYVPHNAKLNGPIGWAPRTKNNPNDYLQLDLGAVRVISAVETQGSGYLREWITLYKLRFKKENDSTTWTDFPRVLSNCYQCASTYYCWPCKQYNGEAMTGQTAVRHDLETPQAARYVRFVPVHYHNHKTMRVNVYFLNEGPPNVTATPYEHSLSVHWSFNKCAKLTTFITGYLLDISTKGEFKADPNITSKNITGLQPYTKYTIRVNAVPYGLWSDNKTVYTDVAVPKAVPDINRLDALSPKSIRVSWTISSRDPIYGPLTGYTITYAKQENGQTKSIDVGLVNTWTIASLQKCTSYSVAVSVKNPKHVGPTSQKATIRTMGNAPLVAPSNVFAISTSPSSIAVSWDPVPEDKLSCDVTGYDVKLVRQGCTDIKKNSTTLVLETGRSTVLTELSPCTYAVSVRAFTAIGYGPFSQPIDISTAQGTANLSKDLSSTTSGKTGTIGLVAALAVVIIVTVLLIIIILKRRRIQVSRQLDIPTELVQPSLDMTMATPVYTVAESASVRQNYGTSNSDQASYSTIPESSATGSELHPLLRDMKFIQPDGRIDEYGLKKQFESVPPKVLQYQCSEAEKPSNRIKNRYKNIYTYDKTRVVLQLESQESDYTNTSMLPKDNQVCSDYINASFIEGYDGYSKSYIAAQGPLENTTNEFWKMIWDQNSATIVMLTNLCELGKRKCYQYWPESSEQYGDITVRCNQTEVYADYVIRTFLLSQVNQTSRQIRQFHFTVWPDKGVPQHASAILSFRRKVRELTPGDVCPIVVHCSAGVGRTGTYIMIDAMLQQANKQESLDIFNYLQAIRRNRPYMVQTKEQYAFMYLSVYEALSCGNTEIQVENLNIAFKKLCEDNAHQSLLMKEFQRLNAVTRSGGNVADEKHVYLSCKGKQEGEYTNATYVDTYRERNAYIVTQHPTNKTAEDFWRLVMYYDIRTIVMLNKLQENNQTFYQYWPNEKETIACDSIKVKQVKMEFIDDIIVRTIQVINTEKIKVLDVLHLQHTDWDDERIPSDPQSILNLKNEVEKSQQKLADQSPVLVHCSDGVGRSGTFCSIASTLERVKQEQVVDVFQTVKSVRDSRPGAVQTLDQYKFCYIIVQNYLQSFSDYDNFKVK